MKQTDPKALRRRQKKLVLIAAVVVAVWAALMALLVAWIPGGEESAEEPTGSADLQAYISQQWEGYTLVSYDESSQCATVRAQSAVTYAQAKQYGADAYESLMDSYIASARAIAAGLKMECGISRPVVVLRQLSTDGQEIFSVDSDGKYSACWESE